MNTKLYLILFLPLLFFVHCVDNGDEKGGESEPTQEEVPLNEQNILGQWEIYFFTKSMHAPSANLNAKYRYADEDGFSIGFEPNGVFYEKNVFDMEIIRGKYEFMRNKTTNKIDSLRFYDYKSLKTGKDTVTYASIPYLYKNRMVYLSRYYGTAENNLFNIEDLKYLRNMERDPHYYPKDNPAFKKSIIDEEDLLGTWFLFSSTETIDQETFDVTHEKERYGTQTIFKIENGERIFELYFPDGVLSRKGKFRIVDDVIHLYNERESDGKVTNGVKEKNESFAYWVQRWYITGNNEIMEEGYTTRKKENVLQEFTTRTYHRKIK